VREIAKIGLVRPSAEGSSWRKAVSARPRGRRGLFPFVGSTLYVAVAAIQAEGGLARSAWTGGLVALGVALLATRRAPGPLRATSFATWGLALTLASLGGSGQSVWVDAFGAAGVAIAAVSACAALDRLPAPVGVAASLPSPKRRVRSLAMAMLLAPLVIIFAGCASRRVRLAFAGAGFPRDDLAAWGAAYTLAVLAAIYWDRLRVARLVLGAAPRARTAFASIVAFSIGAGIVVIMEQGLPAPVLRTAAAGAGVLASVMVLEGSALRFVRIGRRVLTLLLFGGPVVLLGAIAAEGLTGSGPPAVFFAGVAALAIGTLGAWLERPLRPGEGRWLDAVALAREALARADPETSVRDALVALRAAAGTSAESPELWSLDPTRVLTIDAAGYARERPAALPPLLLQVGAGEPELTVRAELLDALVVRRPDLRPLARWMDERGALCCTLVMREGEVCGVLVAPRGSRGTPLGLEEACALRSIADALSGACAGKSALARSLGRERDATARAEAAEHALARSEHTAALLAGQRRLGAAHQAQAASVGQYSPPVRMAQMALERRMKMGAPLVVVAPASVDPVPYLARAHLAGPRPGTPFVVVDCAASKEHEEARWRDPVASPLALAQGGLLVLVDGAALPLEVQRVVAQALAERRPPWASAEPLDVVVALTSVAPPAELIRTARIEPALLARFDDAYESAILLPRLQERAEDLRPILIDRLAREGLRQRGAPVGIDDAAFARLADYAFPGDYAELATLAQRLVAGTVGDVVHLADVDALGLVPAEGPRVNVRASHSVS
jgi:hypothetical protein